MCIVVPKGQEIMEIALRGANTTETKRIVVYIIEITKKRKYYVAQPITWHSQTCMPQK